MTLLELTELSGQTSDEDQFSQPGTGKGEQVGGWGDDGGGMQGHTSPEITTPGIVS